MNPCGTKHEQKQRRLTLLGSLRIRYLPSSSLRQMSMTQRRIPQAFSMLRLIWLANSLGLNCWVPRMTWRAESFTWYRDTYLSDTAMQTPVKTLANWTVCALCYHRGDRTRRNVFALVTNWFASLSEKNKTLNSSSQVLWFKSGIPLCTTRGSLCTTIITYSLP